MKKDLAPARSLMPGQQTVVSYWLLGKSGTEMKAFLPEDAVEKLLHLMEGHIRQSVQTAIQDSLGYMQPRSSFETQVADITNAACEKFGSEAPVEIKRKIRYHVFDLLEREKGPREEFSTRDIEVSIVNDPRQISPDGRKVDCSLSDASVYAMTFGTVKKIIAEILESELGQNDADMKPFLMTLDNTLKRLYARKLSFQAHSALAWIKARVFHPLRAVLHL